MTVKIRVRPHVLRFCEHVLGGPTLDLRHKNSISACFRMILVGKSEYLSRQPTDAELTLTASLRTATLPVIFSINRPDKFFTPEGEQAFETFVEIQLFDQLAVAYRIGPVKSLSKRQLVKRLLDEMNITEDDLSLDTVIRKIHRYESARNR